MSADLQHTVITLLLVLMGMFVMMLCVWTYRLWQEARYLKQLLTEDTSIALRAGQWWRDFESTSKKAILAPLVTGIVTMMIFSEVDRMATRQGDDYQYGITMAILGGFYSAVILVSSVFVLLTRMSLHRFPQMVSMSSEQLGHQLSERIMDLAVSLYRIHSQRLLMQTKVEELHQMASDPFHDATHIAMMESKLEVFYQSDQATCSIIEQQSIALHEELVHWPSADPASGARLLAATETICKVASDVARTEPPFTAHESTSVDEIAPLLAGLEQDCKRFFQKPIL